jgi:formylglycine-generating enzyme required for sulfatase activity
LSIAEGKTPCYSVATVSDWATLAYSSIPTTTTDAAWDAATCNFAADGYRLPTEAEWEYAARGGNLSLSPSFYYSGSNTAADVAWYTGNNGASGSATYGTKNVKGKTANALGLYDMSGNVWEWCWNWYASSSYAANEKGTNPVGPATGSTRVIRGGYWGNTATNCRVSYRYSIDLHSRLYSFGFRVVMAP